MALARQAVRKIDLMHQLFGTTDHKCGECTNLVCGRYHDYILRKCKVYGLTHSEASDWRKKWTACGMFNKDYNKRPIIELVKMGRDKAKLEPLEGQIKLED